MSKKKVNKVIKGLEKASKTHAQQAKTLKAVKFGKGGDAKSKVPSNVANPSLYRKARAKAKAKFDVFPSAYASGYMVQEYKRMGGKYKGAKKGKGLSKLPTRVRNKMGFMKSGGAVMLQARGCGAIMDSKRKPTKVPRS